MKLAYLNNPNSGWWLWIQAGNLARQVSAFANLWWKNERNQANQIAFFRIELKNCMASSKYFFTFIAQQAHNH
jgi:hypothetical protein